MHLLLLFFLVCVLYTKMENFPCLFSVSFLSYFLFLFLYSWLNPCERTSLVYLSISISIYIWMCLIWSSYVTVLLYCIWIVLIWLLWLLLYIICSRSPFYKCVASCLCLWQYHCEFSFNRFGWNAILALSIDSQNDNVAVAVAVAASAAVAHTPTVEWNISAQVNVMLCLVAAFTCAFKQHNQLTETDYVGYARIFSYVNLYFAFHWLCQTPSSIVISFLQWEK